MTARITPGGRREVGLLVSAFARLAGRATGTEPPSVFLTLGRHRRLFWGWLLFAGALMPGGRLARRETELVILRVGAARGSEYELTQHRRLGRRAGLSADEIERVEGGGLEGWSRRHRLLLEATDELLDADDLSDDTWTRPGAVRATKALLQQAPGRSLDEQRLAERTAQAGRFREIAASLGSAAPTS